MSADKWYYMSLIMTSEKIKIVVAVSLVLLNFKICVAENKNQFQTHVTVDIPLPSCNLQVPEIVNLGSFSPGESKEQRFDLIVNCSGQTVPGQVELFMTSNNTLTLSDTAIHMKNSSGEDTDILLEIKGNRGNTFTRDKENPVMIHEGSHTGSWSTTASVYAPTGITPTTFRGMVTFHLRYQ